MPSKAYLDLHATCCKVAAMSGAAELLDKLDREAEVTPVLASDGSSSELLTNALWHAVYSYDYPQQRATVVM